MWTASGLIISFCLFLCIDCRINLIESACKRQPNLLFCSNSTSVKSNNKSNSTTLEPDKTKAWLKAFLDEAPDDDDDGEINSQRHNHTNVQAYCVKYNHNYNSYCSADRVEELEGVLSTFCLYYKRSCDANLNINKVPEKEKTEFPTPQPLEQEFHMSKEYTEDIDPIKSSQYCQRFATKYGERCSSSSLRKQDDFCTSYQDNCNPHSEKKESSISEELELPPDQEDDLNEEPDHHPKKESAEGESSDTVREKQAVNDYCEQYSENYNYYCAGESSEEHAKFCASFASNCPQKIES